MTVKGGLAENLMSLTGSDLMSTTGSDNWISDLNTTGTSASSLRQPALFFHSLKDCSFQLQDCSFQLQHCSFQLHQSLFVLGLLCAKPFRRDFTTGSLPCTSRWLGPSRDFTTGSLPCTSRLRVHTHKHRGVECIHQWSAIFFVYHSGPSQEWSCSIVRLPASWLESFMQATCGANTMTTDKGVDLARKRITHWSEVSLQKLELHTLEQFFLFFCTSRLTQVFVGCSHCSVIKPRNKSNLQPKTGGPKNLTKMGPKSDPWGVYLRTTPRHHKRP